MTDHAGNIIQTGDTLILICTRNESGGLGWEVMERLAVVASYPEIFVAMMITPEFVAVHHIDFLMKHMTEDCILCIEGKSDNETDYYLKYFEV